VNGQSLELYFVDGNPDGMLTAEVFNWTGHVLMVPRTQLKEGLSRAETKSTGVYILMGDVDGDTTAYIGESEDVGARVRNHASKKDWWDKVIFVTTKGDSLHKAHVKFLESRLVDRAKKVGKVKLDNGNMPPLSSLSEACRSNMESFLDFLFLVLPALRIDMFLEKTRPEASVEIDLDESLKVQSIIFQTVSKRHKLKATAILRDGEFIVQKGSLARIKWSGDLTEKTYYWKLFEELVKSGILRKDGNKRIFSENYAFTSPSAAGAMVHGRSCKGPTEWKVQSDGRTYREWEADRIHQED